MARGPKPAPAGVRSQLEPVRSKRKPAVQVEAVAARPSGVQPPDWLGEEGLKVWGRLAQTLNQAKLLSEADVGAFGRYCRNFARWLKMQQALDDGTETYMVKTASGDVHRPRPEFLIADRLERMLLAAEDRFGLNPVERQRIMAARAHSGVSGDLFDAASTPPRDPAAPAAQAAQPIPEPVGMLN